MSSKIFGFRRVEREKQEKKHPLEDYFPDEWHDHDENEPCPRCGSQLKQDPIGGFFLKCSNCGWKGW